MSPNDQVALVAESQYGLLTYPQAIRSGLTARTIRRRLGAARWVPVYQGVYRVAGAPQSCNQQLLAAILASGPSAVASHRAAARLWGLDGFVQPVRELSVPRSQRPRLADATVHCSTDLDRSVATTQAGIPVSSPARTLLDLGAVMQPWRVERAVDCAVGRKLVTLPGLWAELEAVARRGRRGAGVLRKLLEDRGVTGGNCDTVLEARMLRVLRTHGVPMPICQYEVRVGERLLGRVDFAYPENRLAVEVDGYESHSSLEAFRSDRARQNDLVEAGWTVLRFTWHDVNNRPGHVAARILRVLATLTDRFGT